jgi:uroporphyrin-III C-methyltransferase
VSEPLVSFVGAGPGDPELITLKGLRLLREADVVIHDRLIPHTLLAEAHPGAEIIDVGKSPRQHCLPQVEINRLMVEVARRGRRVVRLKGGDPAVFARLAEEIEAVAAAGLPFEVVPGVTAATAAAALAGISLTERGRASTVVFATGTDHSGRVTTALDWPALARTEGTLVFYMAVHGLETVVSMLVTRGRHPGEPAVVIEHVGAACERVVAAPLGEIADRAREAVVTSPAVLITGPTVAFAQPPWNGRTRRASRGARPSIVGS